MRGKYDIIIRPDARVEIILSGRTRKAFRQRIIDLGLEYDARLDEFYGNDPEVIGKVKEIFTEEYPDWVIYERDERPKRRPGHRVAWANVRQGLNGGHLGYLNGRRMFSIRSHYTREDGTRYYLYTDLPDFELRGERNLTAAAVGSSELEMEDAAEEVLEKHLERLGAIWKEKV